MPIRKTFLILQVILVALFAMSGECWARQDIFGLSFPLCRNRSDCGDSETPECHWCDIHLTVSGPIDNGPITFQFIGRSEDDSLRILSKSDVFIQEQATATYKMEDLIEGFGSSEGWSEIVLVTQGRPTRGASVYVVITDPWVFPMARNPSEYPAYLSRQRC